MTYAGDDAVLTVLAKPNAKLGLIFLDVKRAAESIIGLL
jgi:predicted regulator of Ras-like GTPase activity (Roadblock/LC7/MglB family)